jgi:hypothetical protein
VVRSGDVKLEILRYDTPQGKPRPADHRASDQCFFNAAFGSRQLIEVSALIERLQAAGVEQMNIFRTPELLATYVNQPERETEFSFIPKELDAILGFEPLTPFFG